MESGILTHLVTGLLSLLAGGGILHEYVRRRTSSKDEQSNFYSRLNDDFIKLRENFHSTEMELRQLITQRDRDYVDLLKENATLKKELSRLKKLIAELKHELSKFKKNEQDINN